MSIESLVRCITTRLFSAIQNLGNRAITALSSTTMTHKIARALILGAPLTSVLFGNTAFAEDPVSSTATVSSVGLPWFGYLIPLLGVCAIVFTIWKSKWVAEQDDGNETMQGIAKNITEGAMSFLKAEYSVLSIFVVAVAALLGWAWYRSR